MILIRREWLVCFWIDEAWFYVVIILVEVNERHMMRRHGGMVSFVSEPQSYLL